MKQSYILDQLFIYRPIEWYVTRLKNDSFFSLVGYSDAEWFSVIHHNTGGKTSLGQVLHDETGDKLLQVLERRAPDHNFLVAVPDCIWRDNDQFVRPGIPKRIKKVLYENDIYIPFYERDMITDTLAEQAGLFPLIQQLQKMPTVLIGNEQLAGIDFLGENLHIPISSPNLHLEPNGIDKAVERAVAYGKPAVYLVSAGVSAALIIDQLQDEIPFSSFFMDCGSIWDAFVGIGEQRLWRKKLYDNPVKWEVWKHDNLCGKS